MALLWIVKDSYIFAKPRDYLKSRSKFLNKLLSCSLCLGFWIGVLLLIVETLLFGFSKNFVYYPLAVSGFCWFFDSVLNLVQEKYVYYKNIRENNK
jgi:TRAP-type C4-dicarboxylate transport system permease small subunit